MVAALSTGAIQGFVASAPFWAAPVANGTGVFWLSGPGGDFPAEQVPVSAVTLQTTRAFANANPDVIAKIAAVVDDMSKAVGERPQDVKAATAKLYPDLAPDTLDLLFKSESRAWQTKPLTLDDMAGLVAFVKTTTPDLPEIDRLNPASLLVTAPQK